MNEILEAAVTLLKQLSTDAKPSTVVLHSSLVRFRFRRSDYRSLISGLFSDLPGVLFLIPAFTYCTPRGVAFSRNLAPDPQCGALSRVAFEDFVGEWGRSADADFSYFAMPASRALPRSMLDHHTRAFGVGSHYEALFALDPVFLTLGDGFDRGFTPVLHLEALVGVPNRRFRTMYTSIEGLGTVKREYFMREPGGKGQVSGTNRGRLIQVLSGQEGYVHLPLSRNGQCVGVRASTLEQRVLPVLGANPSFFL